MKKSMRDREIQVSGIEIFDAEEWRDAIMYYLTGMRIGNEAVTYRPKIYFGTVTLRFDDKSNTYYAYGPTHVRQPAIMPSQGRTMHVGTAALDVENALGRLAKKEVDLVSITFAPQSSLTLWADGDVYDYHAVGIPEGMMRSSLRRAH